MMGKGSGHEGTDAKMSAASMRNGSQKDYLEGLDNLREMVTAVECDLDKARLEFYVCTENDEDKYEEYVKTCNDKFLYCNNQLRKNGVGLDVIDSEIKLVSLLNKMRDLDDETIDGDVINFLTEFWEHMKHTLESAKGVKHRFHHNVLKRLKSSCISYSNGETTLELTSKYSDVVTEYKTDIVDSLKSYDALNRSFESKLKQELFSDSSFSNRILVSCDQKAFPILRLVPDLSEKIVYCCQKARQWIDKDEIYVHDINKYIRERRNESKKKEDDLKNQKAKQEEITKTCDEAYQLFKENKDKLGKIDTELKTLEEQVNQYTQRKKYKHEERRQKEGMVGFLEISISQTKKNQTLQLKRSRIMRQLRELEDNLKEIERELEQMEKEVETKASTKQEVSIEFEESNEGYNTIKGELDKFNENFEKLEQEVNELTDSLTHVEIIRTFKTSPERVEDLYERPTTVKLAPSLKEKILARKRRLMSTGRPH